MVLFTSVNYWRHPTYGGRRYVDITVVHMCALWQNMRNWDNQEPNRSWAYTFTGIM